MVIGLMAAVGVTTPTLIVAPLLPAARPYPATVGSIQGLGRPWCLRRHDLQRPSEHTRAMPRPVANIVRVCVCLTLRTELATFGRTAVTLSRSLPGRSRGHVPQYAPADVAYDR